MTEPDKKEAIGYLMLLCVVVAVLVTLVDWKIKQEILQAARKAQEQYDLLERRYYGRPLDEGPDGGPGADSVVCPIGDHVVVGASGVEEAVALAEDTEVARKEARRRNRADARARGAHLEVPAGD